MYIDDLEFLEQKETDIFKGQAQRKDWLCCILTVEGD